MACSRCDLQPGSRYSIPSNPASPDADPIPEGMRRYRYISRHNPSGREFVRYVDARSIGDCLETLAWWGKAVGGTFPAWSYAYDG